LAKNPSGKSPLLETPSGSLTNANSILRYLSLSSDKLYGENSFEKAQIDNWLDFCSHELEPLML
jgi:elongation factor 1-gamma